jgi:hypothetical protein
MQATTEVNLLLRAKMMKENAKDNYGGDSCKVVFLNRTKYFHSDPTPKV